MAQLIIVKQMLRRNQNIAHPREREEIQPRMVRYTPLDIRGAQTSRDIFQAESGCDGGIQVEYGDCVVAAGPVRGHAYGPDIALYGLVHV